MPGIANVPERKCFASQIHDSIRRVRYILLLGDRRYGPTFADPSSASFHPYKAAIWHRNNGQFDEACWLVFLATHFGEHRTAKWMLAKAVYSEYLLPSNAIDWSLPNKNSLPLTNWINSYHSWLKNIGKFGNHRKYESLRRLAGNRGTPNTLDSYVRWLGDSDHQGKFSAICSTCSDPKDNFSKIYRSMRANIYSFGRTATFDYLCTLGKLGLWNVEPDKAYISQSTGPRVGAKILFGDKLSNKDLEKYTETLAAHVGWPFAMQVLEDALCNWQKNTKIYHRFNG